MADVIEFAKRGTCGQSVPQQPSPIEQKFYAAFGESFEAHEVAGFIIGCNAAGSYLGLNFYRPDGIPMNIAIPRHLVLEFAGTLASTWAYMEKGKLPPDGAA